MPLSTHWLSPDSKGSSMPSPTLTPPGLAGALVGGLHRTRAAAGDHGEAGLDQLAPGLLADGVEGVVGRRAGRAEDRDRGPELGQRAEALDELGLDPQHAPRVGVHPVGRAARVEQPLVGGAAVSHLAAALDDRALHPVGRAGSVASVAHASHSLRMRSQRSMCSVGTCSSCLCANIGSPGPKLTAGMPSLVNWATSVHPNFGFGLAADGLDERLGRGAVEAGQRAGGHVGHRDVVPLEEVADERLGVGLAAVGGEAEVDLDDALVGDHVAGDAAADAGRVEALVVGQAVDLGLRGRRSR